MLYHQEHLIYPKNQQHKDDNQRLTKTNNEHHSIDKKNQFDLPKEDFHVKTKFEVFPNSVKIRLFSSNYLRDYNLKQ